MCSGNGDLPTVFTDGGSTAVQRRGRRGWSTAWLICLLFLCASQLLSSSCKFFPSFLLFLFWSVFLRTAKNILLLQCKLFSSLLYLPADPANTHLQGLSWEHQHQQMRLIVRRVHSLVVAAAAAEVVNPFLSGQLNLHLASLPSSGATNTLLLNCQLSCPPAFARRTITSPWTDYKVVVANW